MVQIPSLLHCTFKEISNEYSHAQIRIKMKKLWPRQVGEEKQVAIKKLSQPSKLSQKKKKKKTVSRPGNLVATKKTVSPPTCCVVTKKAGENLKRPKIYILAYFQAHFTLGPYIYLFFR